jgi:signal recognition particle receptor subunit beta
MRLRVARSELDMLLENKTVSHEIPYLFYANKNDVKGACPLEEVQELMQLKTLKREYQVVSCSGTTGRGVQDGIEWLCRTVALRMEAR